MRYDTGAGHGDVQVLYPERVLAFVFWAGLLPQHQHALGNKDRVQGAGLFSGIGADAVVAQALGKGQLLGEAVLIHINPVGPG